MTRVRGILGATLLLLAPTVSYADYHIIAPSEIDLGEIEIEHNGDDAFDHRLGQIGAKSYTTELGTGLTSYWHSEIELGFDRAPGLNQPTQLTQVVTENMFQLTEPGEMFADWGFYIEYGQSTLRTAANEITFGPVVAKEYFRTVHTLNLLFAKELGPDQDNHGVDFSYAWQSRWNIWAPLSPALEIYGDTGTIGNTPALAKQQLLAGPVAIGTLGLNALNLGQSGNLKYEAGWLFGTTPASAAGTLRWRIELEIPF